MPRNEPDCRQGSHDTGNSGALPGIKIIQLSALGWNPSLLADLGRSPDVNVPTWHLYEL